jgi:hypothetical protein
MRYDPPTAERQRQIVQTWEQVRRQAMTVDRQIMIGAGFNAEIIDERPPSAIYVTSRPRTSSVVLALINFKYEEVRDPRAPGRLFGRIVCEGLEVERWDLRS